MTKERNRAHMVRLIGFAMQRGVKLRADRKQPHDPNRQGTENRGPACGWGWPVAQAVGVAVHGVVRKHCHRTGNVKFRSGNGYRSAGRNPLLDHRWVLGKVDARMGNQQHIPRPGFIHWIMATGCALLIFALGLFAASPTLHDQLHAGKHASWDDGCAVALFASGVAVTQPVVALPYAAGQWTELPGLVSNEVFLESPRYLLQPERGPPVG